MQSPKRSSAIFAATMLSAAQLFAATVTPEAELSDTTTPIKVSAIEHALFSNASDPYDTDSKATNALMNEALVRAEYDPYSLGVQITNRYAPDMAKDGNRPIVLEKKTAAADWRDWNITLGDSHQEFGRGLALSLYQDKVFGVDYTLEGGSVRFHPSGFDVTAFGGRVNALNIPVAINPLTSVLNRKSMVLAGTSAKFDVSQELKASGHYFYAMGKPDTATDYDKRYQTVGATLAKDNLIENVDAYAESNMLLTDRLANGQTAEALPKGYATYASVAWSPMPWTVKVEGKDFRDYAWDLRRPPTLEEDVVHDPNTTNITAARLYLEHRNAETNTIYYGSYLGGDERVLRGTLNHAVLGTKFFGPINTEFEIKGGYRWVTGAEVLYHGTAKGKIKTFKGQAFELGLRKQYDKMTSLDEPDDRNMIDLGYTFSEKFNVAVGFEYVPYQVTGKDYVNVGATYKTGGLVSKAFVGKTSGGTLCSGGVCRVVPPYTGAMLETTYTF